MCNLWGHKTGLQLAGAVDVKQQLDPILYLYSRSSVGQEKPLTDAQKDTQNKIMEALKEAPKGFRLCKCMEVKVIKGSH